ncbi:hypothetical protein APV28_1899 [Comamonas testosteroni]|nr:hypothetical protein APV28_1899 [Comamonas testosteroni]
MSGIDRIGPGGSPPCKRINRPVDRRTAPAGFAHVVLPKSQSSCSRRFKNNSFQRFMDHHKTPETSDFLQWRAS